MDLGWLLPLISDRCGLGPGSAVGEKDKKRGQMGKISSSKASQAVFWRGGGNYNFFLLFPTMRSLVPGWDRCGSQTLSVLKDMRQHPILKAQTKKVPVQRKNKRLKFNGNKPSLNRLHNTNKWFLSCVAGLIYALEFQLILFGLGYPI